MIFILLLIFPAVIQAELLRIDQGVLNGTILKSARNGHEFHAFYGIPFAQPPIGSLRFQPPKLPPPSWNETRNASQKPPFCPQMNTWFTKSFIGSEDCLFLNVFTRNTQPEKLAPVLVFIHGGGFSGGGSALYDAELFMDEPVVFVLINYRLGVFGLFSTGDSLYPGNYGLKDQVAALQWIQKNIRSFGGDPSAVTIMGHSAGSAAVQFHMLSPSSKDLFHRAILQSGVATISFSHSTAEQAKVKYDLFRQHANCSRPSTNESVECLLALPAEALKKLEITFRSRHSVNAFTPVIESFKQEGAFVVTDPKKFAYVEPLKPSIFGFTSNEVLGLDRGMYKDLLTANITDEKVFEDALVKILNYRSHSKSSLTKNITALIKELYFENDLSNVHNETCTSMLVSDLKFKIDIVESIRTYPGIKYAYEYDYSDSPASRGLGVGHSEELNRLVLFPSNLQGNDPHKEVSEGMLTYWSNFVASGDPNIPDKKLPTEWTPTKSDPGKAEEYFMYISNDGFRVKKGLSSDLLDELWTYIKTSRTT